jgi:NAD(P)-dependent dehydrogenase (short-subunit alcohol dehydrogenase family)
MRAMDTSIALNHYQPAPDLLAGRVILVTGAGQGVGRVAALAFARHGATVILLGRSTGKLEQVYDEIVAAGGAMPAIFPMDLAAAEDKHFDALAQAIAYPLRRLDGILHCAAEFDGLSPLQLQTTAQWQQMFKVNCIAPFAINRACEHLLKAAPDASVVLVGESHGHHPAAYWGGFAVSKAALEAYARVQAEEWQDCGGLRLNLLIPGPINSPQRARSHPGEDKAGLAQVQDLSAPLLYLIGPDSRARRGEIIEWRTGQGQ